MAATKEKHLVYNTEFEIRHLLETAEKREVWSYDFYGHKMQLPRERNFADVESIQRYVAAVCDLSQVRATFPSLRTPEVVERRGGRFADYVPLKNQIRIHTRERNQRWAMREVVVLHELAHACSPGDSHGKNFRGAFVYLVGEAMGPELATIMSAMFWQETGEAHTDFS